MSFSKHVGQAPALDAAGMVKPLNASAQKFPAWKRWVEASGEFDGTGLRDVVQANAIGMDSLKTASDAANAQIKDLEARVAALEAQPALPFPVA